jgi:leucyl aminopeptidase (aminopeptidase T)
MTDITVHIASNDWIHGHGERRAPGEGAGGCVSVVAL